MKFCEYCGKEYDETVGNCPFCGGFADPTQFRPEPVKTQISPDAFYSFYSQKPESQSLGFLRKIGSFLLTIVLFAVVSALCTVISGQGMMSKDGIKGMMTQMDIKTIEIGALVPDSGLSAGEVTIEKGDTVSDVVYKYYSLLVDSNITKDEVEAMIGESTIEDYLSDKMSQLASAVLGYTDEFTLESSEIITLIKENEEVIESHSGYSLTDEDYAEIERAMTEDYGIEEKIVITQEEVIQTVSQGKVDPVISEKVIGIIAMIFSPAAVFVLAVAAVILTILLLLCTRFDIGKTSRALGTSGVVSGGLFAAFPFIIALASDLIQKIPNISTEQFDYILKMVGSVTAQTAQTGIYFLVIGVILLIVGIGFGISKRKKA